MVCTETTAVSFFISEAGAPLGCVLITLFPESRYCGSLASTRYWCLENVAMQQRMMRPSACITSLFAWTIYREVSFKQLKQYLLVLRT